MNPRNKTVAISGILPIVAVIIGMTGSYFSIQLLEPGLLRNVFVALSVFLILASGIVFFCPTSKLGKIEREKHEDQ